MKQKKFGKKVQNWHRPLGPSQLAHRFRRLRYETVEPSEESMVREYIEDKFWDPYDPYWDDDYRVDVEKDLQDFLLRTLKEDIVKTSPPSLSVESVIETPSDRGTGNEVLFLNCQRPASKIEERLAKHINMLNHHSIDSVFDAIPSQLKQQFWVFGSTDAFESDYYVDNLFLRKACLFVPFWLSNPQAWDRKDAIRLLDQLFVYFEVPKFLYREWFRHFEGIRPKWLCWFIILGQGGSLQRASKFFNWLITSKFQHYLMDAPLDASPVEACIFAEVKRLGGSENDFRRIHQNLAFIIDPTEPSIRESHSRFWYDAVSWIIKHSNEITDVESDLILSWAMHEYTETERARVRSFSWKGRTVRRVIERSRQYDLQKRYPCRGYKWQGNHFDWTPEDTALGGWSFVELTTGPALYQEGRALKHCVVNYSARCASGHSAIVSMRYQGESRVTIEIAPATKQIVQAKGMQNRSATSEEQELISQWMKKVVCGGASDQTN